MSSSLCSAVPFAEVQSMWGLMFVPEALSHWRGKDGQLKRWNGFADDMARVGAKADWILDQKI
jgi:hypothetical protein